MLLVNFCRKARLCQSFSASLIRISATSSTILKRLYWFEFIEWLIGERIPQQIPLSEPLNRAKALGTRLAFAQLIGIWGTYDF
jgi:hypothetical protein